MADENCVYLTQSCLVRGLSKKQYNVLVDVCLKINDIRNCAVELTPLVKSDNDVHYEKLNFKSIISRFKKEYKTEYSIIQAEIANSTIKKHVDSFNGFIALKNKSIDGEYKLRVNPPKKHEDSRLHNIIIPEGSITSSLEEIKRKNIELPLNRI